MLRRVRNCRFIIIIIISNYVAEIQSTCCPNEQLVAGQHVAVNMGNMLLGNTLPWCKRDFKAWFPLPELTVRVNAGVDR